MRGLEFSAEYSRVSIVVRDFFSAQTCLKSSRMVPYIPMCRLPELREFCAEHGLVLTSIQDLRCLIRERQRAGVLAGADPSLSCIISR